LSASAAVSGTILDISSANNTAALSTPVEFHGPDDLFANGFE